MIVDLVQAAKIRKKTHVFCFIVQLSFPSVDSSIATESEKGNCVSEEKNDICPANDSKDTILINENNDDDKALFQKESSPMAEQDDSNLSTCSDWFNTTREEMILYEKFGEDYDVVVEKMTKEEKIRLKEEVSKASPKKVEELLGENEVTSKNYNQNEISSPENKVKNRVSERLYLRLLISGYLTISSFHQISI